jgi:hypothetical protein
MRILRFFLIPLFVAFLAGVAVELFKLTFLAEGEKHKTTILENPAAPAPKPSPAPIVSAVAPPVVPSKETDPRADLYLRKGDYTGVSSRTNTDNGMTIPDRPRIWHVKVGEKGIFERANIYIDERLVYTLVVTGSYIGANTFVGKTYVIGSGSYTPDDITVTVSDSRNGFDLNWVDPIKRRQGYASMTFCSDAATTQMIVNCGSWSLFKSRMPNSP